MLNVSMNQLGTVYATKRRRRNGKSIKPPPKDGVAKSNPSKRHRERLNAELDTLASLLPFEQNILSKLDRLSILRLAVSYLRTKSYFQVSMVRDKDDGNDYRRSDLPLAYDHTPLDGEMFLQALNGFLLILTCDGEVFFATHSIESYLGFHQSDIVHQSVYELVHSEDREELQRQLMWNAFCPAELSGISLQETIHTPDHCHFLERSFTVRFRCLLDNTSGFLRLDIRGRIKVLHGQNRKSEDPPLALFALCTPFGPPSLLEVPQKEVMFKSKHKLDLSLVSMDQRGKLLIGYSDTEFNTMGGYDLVHFDDLAYVASAHQELLKTGASGLIAYRLQTKDGSWQWLQTSSRLVYKNSKPDFIISTHRPLMEEEGRDLLGKRTMDFKVSYLDAGLTNSYFADQDSNPQTTTPSTTTTTPKTRRYKTQLRDFLASCRSKRKIVAAHQDYPPQHISNHHDSASSALQIHHAAAAAAAAAATYSATTPYNCNVYNNYSHTSEYVPQQQFYHPHPTNFDNRYLENSLFQYRTLGYTYPDYNTTTPYNGFIDVSRGCLYDSSSAAQCTSDYKPNYISNHNHQHQSIDKKLLSEKDSSATELKPGDYLSHYTNGSSSADNCQLPRQTVLMWGSSTNQPRHNSSSSVVIQPQYDKKYPIVDPLRSLSEMNSNSSAECKWGSIIKSSLGVISSVDTGPTSSAPSSVAVTTSEDHHHSSPVSTSAACVAAAKSLYLQGYPSAEQGSNASELFSISSRYLLPPLHPTASSLSSSGCCSTHPSTNSLVISSSSGESCGVKPDRSPLLSISEVTNTLLNHE